MKSKNLKFFKTMIIMYCFITIAMSIILTCTESSIFVRVPLLNNNFVLYYIMLFCGNVAVISGVLLTFFLAPLTVYLCTEDERENLSHDDFKILNSEKNKIFVFCLFLLFFYIPWVMCGLSMIIGVFVVSIALTLDSFNFSIQNIRNSQSQKQ